MNLKSKLTLASLLYCVVALLAFKANEAETKLKTFNIEIIKSDREVYMTCNSGCVWEKLSFNSPKPEPWWVDENGVSRENNVADGADKKDLTNFRFSIVNTHNGVELNGLKGTAWTSLTFTLKNDQPQLINQMGMLE